MPTSLTQRVEKSETDHCGTALDDMLELGDVSYKDRISALERRI